MLAVCMALVDSLEEKNRFADLYDRLERKLFALSMGKLHDPSLAEDAVSETFLRLAVNWKKLKTLDDNELTAYVVIINRNLCFDMLNSESRFHEAKNISAPEDNDDELAQLTAEAVSALPDIYKDTIMLSYYYGFSNEEIAGMLGLSLGGVKKRLSRAREMLRKELVENG